jgi:hypothetical protein
MAHEDGETQLIAAIFGCSWEAVVDRGNSL